MVSPRDGHPTWSLQEQEEGGRGACSGAKGVRVEGGGGRGVVVGDLSGEVGLVLSVKNRCYKYTAVLQAQHHNITYVYTTCNNNVKTTLKTTTIIIL